MGDEMGPLEMDVLAVCSDVTAGRRVRGRDEENASPEQKRAMRFKRRIQTKPSKYYQVTKERKS